MKSELNIKQYSNTTWGIFITSGILMFVGLSVVTYGKINEIPLILSLGSMIAILAVGMAIANTISLISILPKDNQ